MACASAGLQNATTIKFRFQKLALAAARQWLFIPALQQDTPVAVWVVLPFHFKLR